MEPTVQGTFKRKVMLSRRGGGQPHRGAVRPYSGDKVMAEM